MTVEANFRSAGLVEVFAGKSLALSAGVCSLLRVLSSLVLLLFPQLLTLLDVFILFLQSLRSLATASQPPFMDDPSPRVLSTDVLVS